MPLRELAFHIDDKKKIAALKDMDIEDAQDGELLYQERLCPDASQIKVNGMNLYRITGKKYSITSYRYSWSA